jgi:hypothetical protein
MILLKELCKFLNKLMQHSEENKMTSANIAICFAPNLLRMRNESLKYMMSDTPHANTLMQTLIEEFDYFFKEETSTVQKDSPPKDSTPQKDEKSQKRRAGIFTPTVTPTDIEMEEIKSDHKNEQKKDEPTQPHEPPMQITNPPFNRDEEARKKRAELVRSQRLEITKLRTSFDLALKLPKVLEEGDPTNPTNPTIPTIPTKTELTEPTEATKLTNATKPMKQSSSVPLKRDLRTSILLRKGPPPPLPPRRSFIARVTKETQTL